MVALAATACGHRVSHEEIAHRELRALNLSRALDNDRLQHQNSRPVTEVANRETARIHDAIHQSNRVRLHIDDWLENTFPALPRRKLDALADRIHGRIERATSAAEAAERLRELRDLESYVFSLNRGGADPQEFEREIEQRADAAR